jgi:acyl-coenzyme A synthetase/AMP-(fatty) acid ligase
MRQQEPTPEVEAAEPNIVDLNVAARLLDIFARSKHYALAYVDSLGVIERLTSADAFHKAEEWAYLMRAHDVRSGDPVIVLADRDREWRFASLGVMLVGGVAVPCPADTPVAEMRAIAADAGAALIVSGRARPDLVEPAGPPMLSADDLDRHAAASATMELVYRSKPGDVALILYRRDAAGLHGVRYTHSALIAQAEDGEHWLGVREGERIWCTAPDGSVPSIWLLLAAWHAGAELVTVDVGLEPGAQLELLDKLHASAIWLTDDEYRVLAPAAAPAWVELASVRRALTSGEPADGAIAFGDAFDAKVAPVYGLAETGVLAGWPLGRAIQAAPGTGIPLPGIQLAIVDEQGNELPSGEIGDVLVRGGAPSFFAGYTGAGGPPGTKDWFRVGGRGAVEADGRLRLSSDSPRIEAVGGVSVSAPVEEEASTAVGGAAAAISNVPEAPSAQDRSEARRARRRAEQEAKERRKAQERRLREEEESRKRAEKEKRAEREAAEAEERRLAEEAKRAEREAARADEQRRVEEDKKRRLAERTAAEERRRAEQADREAAKAEERRRIEEDKKRSLAERTAAEERRRAEQADREAAKAEERRRAEEEKRLEQVRRREAKLARRTEEQEAKELQKVEERRRREEEKNRKATERAERDRLAAEAKTRKAEAERLRAEEAERERLEVEAADAETSGERRERIGHEERQRESQIPRDAAHVKSDREMDIVSRISQYGMGTVVDRKQREDDAGVLGTVQPDEETP